MFIKKSQQKKTSSSGKGHDSYFFGPNITSKKVWVPRFQQKKCMSSKKKVPQKKKFILFGAKHSMGSKKSMSSKKRNSYFFRAKHCARKSKAPKIRVPKKKELILSFFEPHIVPKKV